MAIMQLKGSAFSGIGDAAELSGITAITQASLEKSAGTAVRAKDGNGEIKAVLIGKEVITMSVSGYSTEKNGALLGTNITVAGQSGKVISANIEASAEDFTKFSAEGRAISPKAGA